MTRVEHRVASISFGAGVVTCTCGETMRNDQPVINGLVRYRAGTDDCLAGAFSAHRTTFGLSSQTTSRGTVRRGPDIVITATHQRVAT